MPLNLKTLEANVLAQAKKDPKKLAVKEQVGLLRQHAEQIVLPEQLLGLLNQSKKTRKPLRIKLGIDATGPQLHLGHAVPLLVAQIFQRLGHRVIFIVGDFTATIGDPSGSVKERPILTAKEVAQNVRTYERQAALFLNMAKVEVRFNSEWLAKIKLAELFGYLRLQTVAGAMEREDFRKRKSVTRAELLYASLQAIDSVKIGADVEIGGHDQLLNFLEGRQLMERLGLVPQAILTAPLLPGTTGTGEKMSKSKHNFIAVTASASEVYGALMAVHDRDVLTYLRLLTFMPPTDLNKLGHALKNKAVNPKEVKQLMARLVTRLVHPGTREVGLAEAVWEKTFSRRELPTEIKTMQLAKKSVHDLADLLTMTNLVSSRSEAKRLVSTGSVNLIDQSGRRQKISSLQQVAKGGVLQVGKRRFVKIIWK